MTSSGSFSLGKSERLKSRKQIDILFGEGKKINIFPFRLLYRTETGGAALKAGFTVSSKNFPHAVDRNRIKRLTREAYRLQKIELEELIHKNKEVLHLFFIYTGREITSQDEICICIKQILGKLIQNLNAIYSKNT
jgi:ribonuclease P protein component